MESEPQAKLYTWHGCQALQLTQGQYEAGLPRCQPLLSRPALHPSTLSGSLSPTQTLTCRPSLSCPFIRLSSGKETMLFRFCTCKKLRPRPKGIRVQGGTRRQRRAAGVEESGRGRDEEPEEGWGC